MDSIIVRPVSDSDYEQIQQLASKIYPESRPWSAAELDSHRSFFAEGQLVAVDAQKQILGYCASLIVKWDEYDRTGNWRHFTGEGLFANHDPENGKTLYGADVMVDPVRQGLGIGKKLYQARRDLVRQWGLYRIRAGARLRDYHKYQATMLPEEYVEAVVGGRLADPTLTFQLKQGFKVIDVVQGYIRNDLESLGYAAVIEWVDSGKPESQYQKPKSESQSLG